jgi:signal transduction histidine kinase/CheY-like chemotaxis protein
MAGNPVDKYAAEELFGIQSAAIALADKNKKVVWFNQSFKKYYGTGRIKGVTINNLFNLELPDLPLTFENQKSLIQPLAKSNSSIIITPLHTKTKKRMLDGYMLEIVSINQSTPDSSYDAEILQRNIAFQNELQQVLILLDKESSLDVITEEIILRCVNTSNSNFGLIVFQEDRNRLDLLFHDPNNFIEDRGEFERIVNSDFAFISKWLERNNQPLIALNKQNNIGFNLAKALKSESLLICPGFFDKTLLASIIVGKKEGNYSSIDISRLEQFATLLSFTISNIKTRELNTALESRLLQSQKLETIGKLSSGMAHDFSNLLSSIFGSLNLLRKRVSQNETVDRLIDNIENCSVRAKDLTKGLLSYGKPTPKRKELVKPNILVNEISKVVNQTFPGTITYTCNTERNLYDILGNNTEIYQILLNLCINAKEATDEKGTIELLAKNVTIDKENISTYPWLEIGNYVGFSVTDNGSGIEEGDLLKIFDPYFSTKLKYPGSGLGLYVTYGIIKAHKGYIDVSSSPNQGTTFDVYIPSYEPHKIAQTDTTDKIILLADDEPMLSELLAELLESNGFYVIKVSSGKETIKVLTEEIKVDLAIIDYNMPEMNGLETIEKIRDLNFDLPIILSSGSMHLDADFAADKYRIDSSLQKPYEFDTMLTTIKKLF